MTQEVFRANPGTVVSVGLGPVVGELPGSYGEHFYPSLEEAKAVRGE